MWESFGAGPLGNLPLQIEWNEAETERVADAAPVLESTRLAFVVEAEPLPQDESVLLDKIIQAMGYQKTQVLVFFAAPGTSPAAVAEHLCSKGVRVAVAMGDKSALSLFGTAEKSQQYLSQIEHHPDQTDLLVLTTFSPGHLLKNPQAKKAVWEDMKLVMARLEKMP